MIIVSPVVMISPGVLRPLNVPLAFAAIISANDFVASALRFPLESSGGINSSASSIIEFDRFRPNSSKEDKLCRIPVIPVFVNGIVNPACCV